MKYSKILFQPLNDFYVTIIQYPLNYKRFIKFQQIIELVI